MREMFYIASWVGIVAQMALQFVALKSANETGQYKDTRKDIKERTIKSVKLVPWFICGIHLKQPTRIPKRLQVDMCRSDDDIEDRRYDEEI